MIWKRYAGNSLIKGVKCWLRMNIKYFFNTEFYITKNVYDIYTYDIIYITLFKDTACIFSHIQLLIGDLKQQNKRVV